ncbi:MAG: type VI secretion system tip protein VgrG [Chitinophagaceae bacterium]|nr:type VI secretion system tip protein VgrG [Chitinophagaceae bacterium]
MSQFVNTTIDIEGKALKQFNSFSLTQMVSGHHSFKISCPTESLDGTNAEVFHSSKNVIGSSVTITIEAEGIGEGSLKFLGVITQLETARQGGHAGELAIYGYSPTILLDSGIHCKSWEEKKIKDIVNDVLKHFPSNLLKPSIAPGNGDTIPYLVQYKETAWQFLCRLADDYGEWLYYNGEKLVVSAPASEAIRLVYGSTLYDFNINLKLQPADFQTIAYDYSNSSVYNGAPAGIPNKSGLSDWGKHVYKKSEQFFATKPKQWHTGFLTTKKQLDDWVETKAVMRSSNMVTFRGSSDHPAIGVGAKVSVDGKNVFDEKDETYGEYVITSVTHYCNGLGEYENSFSAIPASAKMPPPAGFPAPRCETQSAVVTDNNDPDGLGRIRVKFHWMNGSEKSPWIRMTAPHAGNEKGIFFIPETDEEVIVGFEGDNPTEPFIIGTVYKSDAKTSFSNKDNDVKAIQTRSGNKIIMNDKEGSVFVEDKDGNSIKIDGEGNIAVLANKQIALTCGKTKIEMKEDGTIDITGTKITVNAQEKAQMVSNQASFTAESSGDAKMEGTKANVNGSVEVKVAGGAKTDISASGTVAVKGALITLN